MSSDMPLPQDFTFREILQIEREGRQELQPQNLLILIKEILSKSKIPSCYDCQKKLLDSICVSLESQIYCQQCSSKALLALKKKGQPIQSFEHQSLDLGKRINELQHWSIGDELQYQALAEQSQSAANYQGLASLILLGNNMLNQKKGAQVLQYIIFSNRNKQGLQKKQISNLQNLVKAKIEISPKMLSNQSEQQQGYIFMKNVLRNNGQNSIQGVIKALGETKDQQINTYLFERKVQETKTKISIYKELIEQYNDFNCIEIKKIESLKQFENNQEQSNTNYQEDPRIYQLEPFQELQKLKLFQKSINRQFQQFMSSINNKKTSRKKELRKEEIKKQKRRSRHMQK